MEAGFALSQIDTTTPHPARMYNALLGGKDNYAADRQAVRQLLKVAPEARDSARANRAFLRRAVRFLAGEAGIGRIIDVGTGTSITDGTTLMAAIDWPAAITALDDGSVPASGGERRVLRLAASLADGIPADLRDAFTGMDTANVDRAVGAMLHASGRRPGRH